MVERRGFLKLLAKVGVVLPVSLLGGGQLRESASAGPAALPPHPSVSLSQLAEPWSIAEFQFTKLVETHRGPRPSVFPGYVIRLPEAIGRRLHLPYNLYTVSRICPHEGCPVNFYRRRGEVPDHLSNVLEIQKFPNPLLLCTCHQSAFDPAQGGKVLEGPAPRPPYTFDFSIKDGKVIIKKLEPGGDKWG